MATSVIAGTVDKVLASVLAQRVATLGLNVYNATPLFDRVVKGGNKKPWQGESFRIPLVTATYKAAQRYANYDILNTNASEPFTAADFEMAGYAQTVTLAGQQSRKNDAVPLKLFDIWDTEIKLAMQSMRLLMETDLFASTNATNGLLSFDTLTDATTTIGGVTGASTWGGTTTASGSFAGQGLSDMMTLWQTLRQYPDITGKGTGNISGGASPDVIITTQAVQRFYWNELQPQQIFQNAKTADPGMDIAWFGVPLIQSLSAATGRMYFINTKVLELRVHGKADFTTKDPVEPTNQDALTAQIIWNGQMGTSERRKSGKLTGLVA